MMEIEIDEWYRIKSSFSSAFDAKVIKRGFWGLSYICYWGVDGDWGKYKKYGRIRRGRFMERSD